MADASVDAVLAGLLRPGERVVARYTCIVPPKLMWGPGSIKDPMVVTDQRVFVLEGKRSAYKVTQSWELKDLPPIVADYTVGQVQNHTATGPKP